MKRPLSQQIAEVRREIALRTQVYPGFVARGKMRQGEADEHLELMRAVQATLEFMQIHEAAIRKAIAAGSQEEARSGGAATGKQV